MFLPRILVILTNLPDAASASGTMERAKAAAVRPAMLRFALPSAFQNSLDPSGDVLFYDESFGLAQFASLLTDETHFLLLAGAHDFSARWDVAISGVLRTLPQKRSLLTGSITPCTSVRQPAAYSEDAPTIRVQKSPGGSLNTLRQSLPALRQRALDSLTPSAPASPSAAPEVCLPAIRSAGETVLITHGIPLVCAAAPVTTIAVDPAFVFGRVDFLDENGLSLDTLSLTAFLMGYSVYVLHQPFLWPLAQPPQRELRLPLAQALPGTAIARFAQLLGLIDNQPRTEAKASVGLFGPQETYDQHVPASLRLRQHASAASMKLWEKQTPLIVSAFVDLPSAPYPQDYYTLRFGFLRQLENLSLLLYTGGSQERFLRSVLPNTQSYPDNSLLPRSLLTEGMTRAQHFARSKPLLMHRAAKRHAEFTHIAWVDLDMLPHPVTPQAVPDFEPLMDDRIHLATVSGIPDASFVLVPARYLTALSREVLSITQLDAELKRGFSEELLWERLFMKHPDWFVIHPMPRRRLLFLTAFDPRLLSTGLQQLLSNLPKPFIGTPADGRRASANDRSSQRSDFF